MAQAKNILVTYPVTLEEDMREQYRKAAPGCRVTFAKTKEVTGEMLADVQIVVGNVPAGLLSAAKNLEFIQLITAGADEYMAPGAVPEGIPIANVTGAFGLNISEHMLGALLMLMKKMHLYRDHMHERCWHYEGEVASVSGSTVLVVGLGDIGGSFAQIVKAMGAYVIGVRRSDANKPDCVDELHLFDKLDELLPRADVVALSLPSTDQTRGMFGAERIARLKPGVFLLNVGRGDVFDEDSLVAALRSGRIAGAGLDVFVTEPLPGEHALWNCENVIITPHSSGGFALRETFNRIVGITSDNLGRYLAGEELRNIVDRTTGYRKL